MSIRYRAVLAAALVTWSLSPSALAAPKSESIWSFVGRVLVEHPEARAALARVDQAEAEARALAAPLYNPSLEIGAEDKRGAAGSPSAYDVGLAYTLEIGGKREARERTGAARAAAAAAGGRAARNELAARTLSLLATREAVIALEENAIRQNKAVMRLADGLSRSYAAGDVGSADDALANILRSQAEADLMSAKAQRAATEAALLSLCACRVQDLPALPAIPPNAPVLSEGEINRYAETSLAVDAAKSEVEVAQGEYDIARANRIPDPTISLGVGSDERQSLYRLGLSIPIPILNDGSRDADAKNRGVITALRERELAVRTAFVRARSAYDIYAISTESWSAWRKRAGSNDQRIAALEKLRSAGELSITEFIVQLRESLDADKQGVSVRNDAWQAYAEWLAATGQALTFAGGN
jgi:cobalt-zinc-cadmium efflux system outer membrane protein